MPINTHNTMSISRLIEKIVDDEFIQRTKLFFKDEVEQNEKLRNEKDWRKNNPKKFQNSHSKYSKSQKGKIAAKRRNAIRAKRLRHLILDLSDEEIEKIKLFYVNCPIGFEVDHIIPIAKGGRHSIDNLQYLTKEANRKKSCKLDENIKKSCSFDWKPLSRKRNYKDHKCIICDREFKSVRHSMSTCSQKCFNYSKTKKYWKDKEIGLKIDPHNPPKKLRRIIRTPLMVRP